MAQRIAVIGAGLMGSGIAQVSAVAGLDVVLRDVTEQALQAGLAGIEKSLARFANKGTITEDEVAAALGRITLTTDLDGGRRRRCGGRGGVREPGGQAAAVRRAGPDLPAGCGAGVQHLGDPDHPDRRGHRAVRSRWSARTSSHRCR